MSMQEYSTIVLRQIVTQMVAPDESALESFCNCFKPRKLAASECFIEAGEQSTQFAFVNSGLLRFFYRQENGRELNKSFAAENHFIGAYSAYLSGSPARFTIEALEPTTLLSASLDRIVELSDQYPCWERFRRLVTEQLYVRKEEREAEFLLDDAEHRYHLFQQRYPGLEERIAQYHVASYIGITPVSLSRIRKRPK
ncbi:MAG: Crp/Fnr family transcriptional regulator [Pseudomonadota bacterium]